MSSVVNVKCWLCPDSFSTNKELKNHAASSKHSVMRVVCPWCFDDEKTYRTSAELLKHVEKRHQYLTEETKKGDFFSENNGYWLSLNPEDYRKLVKPTDYESTIAMQTRSIVSRWLDKLKKKGSKTAHQWKDGWDQARTCNAVSYSPSRPLVPEARLQLLNLELSSAGHIAVMLDEEATIGDVWYRIEILPIVFNDRKSSEGLMRRLQKKSSRSVPTTFNSMVGDRPSISRAAAKTLGVDEKYIGEIRRTILTFAAHTKKRKLSDDGLEKELDMGDEIEIIEPVETTRKEEPKRKDTDNTKEPMTKKPVLTKQRPSESPRVANEAPVMTSEQTMETSKAQAMATTTEATTNTQESRRPEMTEPRTMTLTEDNYCIRQETPEEQDGTICTVDIPSEMLPALTQHVVEECRGTEEKTIEEQAGDILRSGVMPLVPSARREWQGVEPVELVKAGPSPIMWPPNNWTELSAEEKLTVWTYAAMAIEVTRGVILIKDQGELLDRYAFLALPGTKVPTTDSNPAAAIRLTNYNLLKDIHLGKMRGDSQGWVRVFRAAAAGADHTTDGVLRKISHVPLRLTAETEPNL